MTGDTVHIAVGFDHNYYWYSGVMMLSVCINTPGPVCFHALVARDVTEQDRKEIQTMIESYSNQIIWYDIDENIMGKLRLPKDNHLSSSTFNRLFLPKYLPEDIDKVLYLDSDMITLGSLQPLWEMELSEDEPVAMAVDFISGDIKIHNWIGLPQSRTYYNAGFILINLSCWRKEKLSQACLDVILRRRLPFADQDALNLTLGDRARKVHLKYNFQIPLRYCSEEEWLLDASQYATEVHEADASPVVIHYVTSEKPWHQNYQYGEEWLKYKSLSPWKEKPLSIHKIKEYQIKVPTTGQLNVHDMNCVVPAFVRISQHLSNHHRWLYVLLRKTVCTLAKWIKS